MVNLQVLGRDFSHLKMDKVQIISSMIIFISLLQHHKPLLPCGYGPWAFLSRLAETGIVCDDDGRSLSLIT